MNIVMILGAGFAHAAGSPLGAELFAERPFGGSQKREKCIEEVMSAWADWSASNPDKHPEIFIRELYQHRLDFGGTGDLWCCLLTFLALRVADVFPRWYVYEDSVSRSCDNIFEAKVGVVHDLWWDSIFDHLGVQRGLTVLTTNWDIWIERALRPRPTPRRNRPGFHYGQGQERLAAGSAHPSSEYRKRPVIEGNVCLLKLHGSLSWALSSGRLVW